MRGGELYRYGLDGSGPDLVPVRIGSDMPESLERFEDVSSRVRDASLSPSGARVVFDARGELFSVPAERGPTRNLSGTPGVREISPAWSPDGKWIAYLSDATGEYELYVRAQDGSGDPRQITRDGNVWRFAPVWSPDSSRIAMGDRRRRLHVVEVETGESRLVDTGAAGDLDTYRWSPDGRFLVYETTHDSRLPGLSIWSLDEGESYRLGDGLTPDFSPVFGPDGKHLFFLSNRDFQIRFSSFEFNYLYDRATRLYVASLDPDADVLFPPRSDEEKGLADEEEDEEEEEDDTSKDEDENAPPVRVVPDGFVQRTVAVPGLSAGNYASPAVSDGALYYLFGEDDGDLDLYRYDLETREAGVVLEGVDAYELSRDGKKVLYAAQDSWGIVAAEPGQTPESALDLSGLVVKLAPRAEWRQMFDDAWRIGRDWFYDPEMHGVDWASMRRRYGGLVPHVAHRAELDFILGEMIGELEAGHTYVASGDEPVVPRVAGGMLGCELELDRSGRFRIAKIYRGENWDDAYRSPLTEPGVEAAEGDYLLAVDGVELEATDNPYRLLENKADAQVVLTLSDDASGKSSREVTVRTVASEGNLRYIDWVKSRMEMTSRLSGGRIGYIHLPNTAIDGNRMLQKLFYAQADKEALIVDDRYNGGGFIPDRMIEYLSRTTLTYWARRDISSMRTPGFAHDGPKVMLINAYSSSGGDALPYYFRQAGLGPLIGTRTWGGLTGLSGNPELADGGAVLYPTFRLYDTDGQAVENEGVAPDIEVFDLPEAIMDGRDPTLEKGVEVLLEELERRPRPRPEVPRPPDMTR